jgi:hypothetical protein
MATVFPPSIPPTAPPLRPLSIGELFDRAVSIYFRHIVVFSAILLAIVAPIALFQFLQLTLTHNLLDAYLNIFDSALKHPSTPPDLTKLDEAVKAQSPYAEMASLALSGLTWLFSFFALPLANAAVVSGVSRAYLGLPVRFKLCYQDAVRRWGHALLLTLLWLIVLVVFLLFMFFGMVLAAVFIAALGAALQTFGFIVGGIIGLLLGLAVVSLVVMSYMAFASSFIACVLENVDPIRAFTLGITRIFGGGMFRRSFVVAVFMAFVFIGVSIVAGFLDLLTLYFTKSWFLYIAIAQVLNVLYVAFAFVLVSIYYYDIRIRREGFDLQLLADQLSAPK